MSYVKCEKIKWDHCEMSLILNAPMLNVPLVNAPMLNVSMLNAQY